MGAAVAVRLTLSKSDHFSLLAIVLGEPHTFVRPSFELLSERLVDARQGMFILRVDLSFPAEAH
jgi:hypothetical protein